MPETVAPSIRVPPEMYERLRLVAFKRRTKITWFAVAAIDKELTAIEKELAAEGGE